MRILIVEDDAELMSIMSDRLRERGASVVFKHPNKQALACAHKFDGVVLAGVLFSPEQAEQLLPRMLQARS